MGIKKFIKSVTDLLELDEFKITGKKKSIERLLEKLRAKRETLHKIPKKKLEKKEKKALKEELEIITLQIKKGEKILDELKGTSNNRCP